MKNYILIQNDGEIEINSFELIGASTKRGEPGKIGFFGSGLKYSIAYMMRNGIDFKVFSGTNEIVFSLKSEDFIPYSSTIIYSNHFMLFILFSIFENYDISYFNFILHLHRSNLVHCTNLLLLVSTSNRVFQLD